MYIVKNKDGKVIRTCTESAEYLRKIASSISLWQENYIEEHRKVKKMQCIKEIREYILSHGYTIEKGKRQ